MSPPRGGAIVIPGEEAWGALLTDVARGGRLGVDERGTRLRVLDDAPTGDAQLDEALRRFVDKDGKTLSSVLPGVGRKIDREVGAYLQSQGVVRVEEGGLLRGTRYPVADPEPERVLRARLSEVQRGAAPTPVEQSVLGLVSALGITTSVFDADEVGLSRRDLKHRVKQTAASADAGPDAVARAVKEVETAVIAAVTTSMMITGGVSS